jgi:hypothetical protein
MSRTSKARRDHRKKQQSQRPIRRLEGPLKPHAQLVDDDGEIIGGAGLRDREWVMLLGGQVVTATDSAGMMLAMLHHAVAVQAKSGRSVRLESSEALRSAATHEAMAAGKSLDQYLEMLEAERLERRSDEAATGAAPSRESTRFAPN